MCWVFAWRARGEMRAGGAHTISSVPNNAHTAWDRGVRRCPRFGALFDAMSIKFSLQHPLSPPRAAHCAHPMKRRSSTGTALVRSQQLSRPPTSRRILSPSSRSAAISLRLALPRAPAACCRIISAANDVASASIYIDDEQCVVASVLSAYVARYAHICFSVPAGPTARVRVHVSLRECRRAVACLSAVLVRI